MCIRDSNTADQTTALALKDDHTGFRGFYPQNSKSAAESVASIRHFIGPKNKLVTLRSDNSRELIRSAKDLKVHHETPAPYRHEENSRIERDIGVEANGIRCNLQQSGLPISFWPHAGQHFAHYANCLTPKRGCENPADLQDAGPTPWKLRFKSDWD